MIMSLQRIIRIFLGTGFFLFLFQGCEERYDPDIKKRDNLLVVEGLITNEQGPYTVRLSKTGPFGSPYRRTPVSNARLHIVDQDSQKIVLAENGPGNYTTPGEFRGEPGSVYTLQIETDDGMTYRSTPQMLPGPVMVDSVIGKIDTRRFYIQSQLGDELHRRDIDGVYVLLNVSRDDGQYPKFRFQSNLLLQYVWLVNAGAGAPIYDYCWYVRRLADFLDSDMGSNLSKPQSTGNPVAFIPLNSSDMRHIGFPAFGRDDTTRIVYSAPRILMHSLYTLNDDAYAFHLERNKQLRDDGSFFDPIAPQLTGNIYQPGNDKTIVLGFFEASAVSDITLNIRVRESEDLVFIDTLDHMGDLPGYGCLLDEQPDWWI